MNDLLYRNVLSFDPEVPRTEDLESPRRPEAIGRPVANQRDSVPRDGFVIGSVAKAMDIITSIALGLFRGLWFLIHREAESAAFAVDCTPPSLGVSSVRATPGHSARFLAALRSRSATRPQASQWKTRSSRGISPFTCPHLEHLFVDGYHLSAVMSADPYHWVLYPSCLSISPQAASAMAFARWWFPSCSSHPGPPRRSQAWFSPASK